MLDESAYRRPGIDLAHSRPVTMSDGQAWHLPTIDPGNPTHGQDIDDLVAVIAESPEPAVQIVAALAIGGLLLRRNYDLADDDLARILVIDIRERESIQLLETIVGIATGYIGEAL